MGRSFALAKDERGVALVIALLVMGVLLLLGTAFMTISSTETQIAYNERNSVQALYVAEAGVQYALNQIKANTASSPGYYNSSSNLTSTSASFGLGSYTYTLTKLGDDSNGNAILSVTSTGTVSLAKRVISVRMEPTYDSRYRDAAHARDDIEAKGNARTDSYDSSVSPGAASCNPDCPNTKGGVSIDATSDGAMELEGNIVIGGDALVGPGGNPSTAIEQGSNVTILGQTGTESSALAMPSVSVPTGRSSSGELELGGNDTWTLGTAGQTTIVVYDRIELKGNAQLIIQGKVIIYVLDKFEMEGNARVNNNGIPGNFELLFTDAAKEFEIKGNARFFGITYGKNAEIEVQGNGVVFGSLVGKKAELEGNARVHYDETLGGRKDNFSGYKITAWQEVRSQ